MSCFLPHRSKRHHIMSFMLMGERPGVMQICLVTLFFYLAASFPFAVFTDFWILVVCAGDTSKAALWQGTASGMRAGGRFLHVGILIG